MKIFLNTVCTAKKINNDTIKNIPVIIHWHLNKAYEYLHETQSFGASVREGTYISTRLCQVKIEDRFEKGLVPAGECLPGVIWLEVSSGVNSVTKLFQCYCILNRFYVTKFLIFA